MPFEPVHCGATESIYRRQYLRSLGVVPLTRRRTIAEELLDILYESFPIDRVKDGVWEVSAAFSGGIDSTVLTAAAMRKFGPSISIAPVVVGFEGSEDIKAASRAAEEMDLGLELEEILLTIDDVMQAIPVVAEKMETTDPVVISFTIPLYFVLKDEGPKDVLVGHGGDELFGGYARYEHIRPSNLQQCLDDDLEIAQSRVGSDRALARSLGRELVTPYLAPGFIEKARSLPPELKVHGGKRKVALRAMAHALGLSKNISAQKKTAAQYGSGVMKAMKAETKRRGLSRVAELIEQLMK